MHMHDMPAPECLHISLFTRKLHRAQMNYHDLPIEKYFCCYITVSNVMNFCKSV